MSGLRRVDSFQFPGYPVVLPHENSVHDSQVGVLVDPHVSSQEASSRVSSALWFPIVGQHFFTLRIQLCPVSINNEKLFELKHLLQPHFDS